LRPLFITIHWAEMINNKTPITYYGGKQNIAKWVISHFPPHDCYVEPFAGGLAVFFARIRRVKTQVINDTNPFVTNFWQQYRDNASELIRVIEATPYSREEHSYCQAIYKQKKKVSRLEMARVFFVCSMQSFAGILTGGWAINPFKATSGNRFPHRQADKIELMNNIQYKMKGVVIENIDAINLIKKWDGPNTFFYLDPPYPDTDQGDYSGYTTGDFNRMLAVLKGIKGKFLLSCYLKNGMKIDPRWHISKKNTLNTAAVKNAGLKKEARTEALIYNYQIKRISK